jgi:murein L,D-transpeptidase YafK
MTDADIAAARTVQDVLTRFGPAVRQRLKPSFRAAGVAYPPKRLTLLAFKEERRLEVWAGAAPRAVFIREYAVVAASGGPGPKLVQGDGQVPEGIYRILWLNPNSRFHLSMKLDYPNAFDRRKAVGDGRTQLGGDIFIHGNAVSIGCLAMGDEAIEELFVLAADTGVRNIDVVIAPRDLRRVSREHVPLRVAWADDLYRRLETELRGYRR